MIWVAFFCNLGVIGWLLWVRATRIREAREYQPMPRPFGCDHCRRAYQSSWLLSGHVTAMHPRPETFRVETITAIDNDGTRRRLEES